LKRPPLPQDSITVKAPEALETERLQLRRPGRGDAEAVFARYAADPDVTRFLSWPTHRSLDDTLAFIAFSDAEWDRWPGGPYLIFSKSDGRLLGSTGFAFETPFRASTGYVLARDAWGHGYAREVLRAIVGLAPRVGLRRLYAVCYSRHPASARVLEACGFEHEGLLRSCFEFPNLAPGEPQDILCYAAVLPQIGG
jgi:[ribosomal protein S5]-alanine N-acetyltransferase